MRARAGRWLRSRRGLRGLLASGSIALVFAIGAPVVHADDHEITITDAGFDPATVTVFTGEPVTWTNHTASERAVVSDDGTLNSGPLGRDETYGHVFETAGTVVYYEAGDPAFRATIIVEDVPVTAPGSGSIPPTQRPSSSRADSPALFVAVLAVSVIAVGAAAATLIAASRRPDR